MYICACIRWDWRLFLPSIYHSVVNLLPRILSSYLVHQQISSRILSSCQQNSSFQSDHIVVSRLKTYGKMTDALLWFSLPRVLVQMQIIVRSSRIELPFLCMYVFEHLYSLQLDEDVNELGSIFFRTKGFIITQPLNEIFQVLHPSSAITRPAHCPSDTPNRPRKHQPITPHPRHITKQHTHPSSFNEHDTKPSRCNPPY
jgi:hypothetical protein